MDSVQGLYQRHADLYQAQFIHTMEDQIKEIDNIYYHRDFEKAYNMYSDIETKIYQKLGTDHPIWWLIHFKIANCLIWVNKNLALEIYEDIYNHFLLITPKPEYFNFAEACKFYLSGMYIPRVIVLFTQELIKRQQNKESEFRIMEVYQMLAKVLFEYECFGPEKDCAHAIEAYTTIYEYRLKLLGQESPHTLAAISTLLFGYSTPGFENWERFKDLFRIYFTHATIDTLNYKFLQFQELEIRDLGILQQLIDILLSIVDSREKNLQTMFIIRNIAYGYLLLGEFDKAEAALQSIRVYNQDLKPDQRKIPIANIQQFLRRKKTYAKTVLTMILKNYISGSSNVEKFETQKQKIMTSHLAQFLESQGIHGIQSRQAMFQQIEKLKSRKIANHLLQNLLRGQLTFQDLKMSPNFSKFPKQVFQEFLTKQGFDGDLSGMTKQQMLQRVQKIVLQKKKIQQQSVPQQYKGIKIDDIISLEQYSIVEFLRQPNKIVIRKEEKYYGLDLNQMVLGHNIEGGSFLFFPRPNQFCIPREQLLPLLRDGQNIFEVETTTESFEITLENEYDSIVTTQINNIIGIRRLGVLRIQNVQLSNFQDSQQQQQQKKQQQQQQTVMINHLLQMGYRPRQAVIEALHRTMRQDTYDLEAAVHFLSPQHID